MFVSMNSVIVERDIFSLLFKLELSCRCETLRQRWFAVKLMRESTRFPHGLGVNTRRPRKTFVNLERRRTGLASRLIG